MQYETRSTTLLQAAFVAGELKGLNNLTVAVWKYDQIMYSEAGQLLYIPSFASKLLLKEVICKKNPVKNVFFQQNQVHGAVFRI